MGAGSPGAVSLQQPAPWPEHPPPSPTPRPWQDMMGTVMPSTPPCLEVTSGEGSSALQAGGSERIVNAPPLQGGAASLGPSGRPSVLFRKAFLSHCLSRSSPWAWGFGGHIPMSQPLGQPEPQDGPCGFSSLPPPSHPAVRYALRVLFPLLLFLMTFPAGDAHAASAHGGLPGGGGPGTGSRSARGSAGDARHRQESQGGFQGRPRPLIPRHHHVDPQILFWPMGLGFEPWEEAGLDGGVCPSGGISRAGYCQGSQREDLGEIEIDRERETGVGTEREGG